MKFSWTVPAPEEDYVWTYTSQDEMIAEVEEYLEKLQDKTKKLEDEIERLRYERNFLLKYHYIHSKDPLYLKNR